MLTRMGRGETPYEIENGDKVVFSASIIPEPTNEGQRYQSEQLLRMQGARLYDDIHVSGHLREEGHYEMLDALQPQHLIPAHQTLKGRSPYVDLATSQGYKLGRDVHVTQNGERYPTRRMTSETKEARVLEAIRERRELVNAAIDEELPVQHPERLYEATRYILEAGGKRLRPTVTTLAAEAVTGTDPLSADFREFAALDGNTVDVMRAAVAIEVIQSFTLIHDDIMDEDDLRRGVPAVHEQYDISTAILAGDTLYSKAFEFMTETGSDPANGLEAMRMLATTCTEICEGQSLDVSFESRDDILPEEYLEMVELKTAVLYGASAATPAVLLGADDEVVDALYQYGIDSGRAFQIQDDVLDLTVASEELGKQRGSDLVEGRRR